MRKYSGVRGFILESIQIGQKFTRNDIAKIYGKHLTASSFDSAIWRMKKLGEVKRFSNWGHRGNQAAYIRTAPVKVERKPKERKKEKKKKRTKESFGHSRIKKITPIEVTPESSLTHEQIGVAICQTIFDLRQSIKKLERELIDCRNKAREDAKEYVKMIKALKLDIEDEREKVILLREKLRNQSGKTFTLSELATFKTGGA